MHARNDGRDPKDPSTFFEDGWGGGGKCAGESSEGRSVGSGSGLVVWIVCAAWGDLAGCVL